MGFLEKLGTILETAAPQGRSSSAANLSTGDYWSVSKSGSDYQQLKAYRSWVYAAASVIARSVAMIDGHLLTPDDNEVESHVFLDLWEKPCRAWNGTQWRELFVLHRFLTGNFYAEVVTNGLGAPIELWPLAPDRTEIVPSPTDWIKAYRYTGSAGAVDLEPDRVVHSKRTNPNSNYYGLSVVQAAAQAVDLNQMMKNFGLASFRNNATPKTLVIPRDDINPGEWEEVKATLEDSFKGVANANRTGIVSTAVKDIKRLSMSPDEMDYLEGMNLTRDEIFGVTGVHRSKVGMADDINRANAEAADYTFSKDVVAPELGALEDMINSDILPRFDSRLRWVFDNPVPADQDRSLAEASAGYTQAWMTENEARLRIGMDERPEGDRYSVPFSVTLTPANEVPVPAARLRPARLETASFKGLARQVGPLLASHEKAITAAMERYFRSQRNRVLGRLRSELASWPNIEKARAGMDEENDRASLYALLLPLILAAGASGFDYIRRLSDAPVGRDLDRLASERAMSTAGIVTATTLRQLLAALEAPDKAAALAGVSAVFASALGARAPLIGRVEASRMFNFAVRIGSQEAGYEYKQWQTVEDDRVDEVCIANSEGGAIPINDVFPSGDFEPPTDQHPMCRCVGVPATAEDVGVKPVDVDELVAARL